MTSLLQRLAAPVRVRGLRALPTVWTCRRCMATESRTYEDALRLLDTLPTNAAAKKLFSGATPTVPHEKNTESTPKAPHEENIESAEPIQHEWDFEDAEPIPDEENIDPHEESMKSAQPPPPSPHAAAVPEMLAWLARAGINPETLPLRAIHISGSKGKGSTAAYASAILRAGMKGKRVGTYTSPHLITVRERIALDGAPIAKELFARYFFEVWDKVGCTPETAPGGGGVSGTDGLLRPFFFRFMTILALHTFAREGIKDVVLECGIGGEYDATNVLPAKSVSATVVTHISDDHREMLGPDLEHITWHKTGILRKDVPVFVKPQGFSVLSVQRERAKEKGAVLEELRDAEVLPWDDEGSARPFDAKNRALAAAAALYHMRGSHRASPEDVGWMRDAMDEAVPRGRWEVFRDGPTTFYLDGAHTEGSVVGTAAWFARVSDPEKKRILLFNQQERDSVALLKPLVAAFEPNQFGEAYFSRNEVEEVTGKGMLGSQRAAKVWMMKARPGMKVMWERGVRAALGKIRGQEAEVLVTGSMYLVGAVLRVLEGEE